ncbi:hypothetical protein JCM17845_10930 [Iodidimonas gelatinilytica]|uniref:Methylmalonyl-CoA mutase alpha/beta chain catalytic domain-containing protein n=1 Tax=Iodidimonas gelatinilytica TaxID=1236966 RepID=A0A5A7MZE0_9PROT|nr:methylmalonyl-CoA mutase subunit beta [Iodidimonas gelatinilytica]GER00470.1 hypothetical protein JCM17845_10930 [Iodidimonas gelatinilytica]
MPDSTLNLAAGFDTPSYEDWKTLVESGLKGRSFDRAMMSDAPDGFRIKPLYTNADLSPVPDAAGFPGFSPFVRGMTVDGRGWQVHQRHDHPDPKRANSQILKDLERGASGITLVIDPTAQKGVAIHDLEDLDQALLDMDLAIAPLHLEAGRFGIPAAALLMALWDKRGLAFDAVSGHFGVDPLGALAAEGSLLSPLPDALREAGALAAQCHDRFPKMTALSVSSEAAHSAGATEAQELAIALATGLAYLRASEQAGLALDDAARQIRFCLMADTDVTLTIAKFRAMRCLWSRVLMACGVAQPIMALDAQTAPRMMSRRDPMVNVLRATMACFGASIGGADALMISPHTDAIGIADDFARRIARNVQIILAEESHLGRVMDPAGGSFTMEAQSNQLAEKAWDIFQSIEANGGMEAALMDGKIAAMLEKSWSNLQKDVATRRVPLIGVSEFPNIHETAVAVESVDRAAWQKSP